MSNRVAVVACGGSNWIARVAEIPDKDDTWPDSCTWLSRPLTHTAIPQPELGAQKICEMLAQLMSVAPFERVVVAIACPVVHGVINASGNLTEWRRFDLVGSLQASPKLARVKNISLIHDAKAFPAAEHAYKNGVLRSTYPNSNALVIGWGTGLAFSHLLHVDRRLLITSSEGGHIELPAKREFQENNARGKCGCGKSVCADLLAGGKEIARIAALQGLSAAQLPDDDVSAIVAPALGCAIAQWIVQREATEIDVVVIAGRIIHERPDIIPALDDAVPFFLRGYMTPPPIVAGGIPMGGLEGIAAYDFLDQRGHLITLGR